MKKLLKRIDEIIGIQQAAILDQIDSLSRLVQTCLARSQSRILYPVIVTITGESNGNVAQALTVGNTYWLASNEFKTVIFETFVSFKAGAKVTVIGGYMQDVRIGCVSYVNLTGLTNCMAVTSFTLPDPFTVDKRVMVDIWIPGIKTE